MEKAIKAARTEQGLVKSWPNSKNGLFKNTYLSSSKSLYSISHMKKRSFGVARSDGRLIHPRPCGLQHEQLNLEHLPQFLFYFLWFCTRDNFWFQDSTLQKCSSGKRSTSYSCGLSLSVLVGMHLVCLVFTNFSIIWHNNKQLKKLVKWRTWKIELYFSDWDS